jgi:hypothetical protein
MASQSWRVSDIRRFKGGTGIVFAFLQFLPVHWELSISLYSRVDGQYSADKHKTTSMS